MFLISWQKIINKLQTKEFTIGDLITLLKKYHLKLFFLPLFLVILTFVILKNSKPVYEGNFKIKIGQFKNFNDHPLNFVFRPNENFETIVPVNDVYKETKDAAFLAKIVEFEKYKIYTEVFRAKFFNDTLIVDVDTEKNILKYSIKSYSSTLTEILSKDIMKKIIDSHSELFQERLKLINNEIHFFDQFIDSLNNEKNELQKGLAWEFVKGEKLLNATEKKRILQDVLDSKLTFRTFILQELKISRAPIFTNQKLVMILVFSMGFILSLGTAFVLTLKE